MNNQLSLHVAEAVIQELQSRLGFDEWWLELEPTIQKEIKKELADAINAVVEDYQSE